MADDAAAIDFFEKSIRPLIVEKCQSCHGDGESEGRAPVDGPRVAPEGRRERTGRRPERAGREPAHPGGAVPRRTEDAAEAEAVRGPDRGAGAWVASGAPWPSSPAAHRRPRRASSRPPAQRALVGVPARPERPPPAVTARAAAGNEIDDFLLEACESQGITPAPPADRRTWIRRATFDLTGLPPSPDEVAAFLADESAQAFDKRRRPAPGFAGLRPALGPALARRGPLRRLLRRRPEDPHRQLRADRGLAVSRLGGRRVQPRPPVRPVHHPPDRRRPLARPRRGRGLPGRADRHDVPLERRLGPRRRRQGEDRQRHGRRPDRHRGQGVPRPDPRLCPLPRPQVRPGLPAGLLRPRRHLLQHPHPQGPRRQGGRVRDEPGAARPQGPGRGPGKAAPVDRARSRRGWPPSRRNAAPRSVARRNRPSSSPSATDSRRDLPAEPPLAMAVQEGGTPGGLFPRIQDVPIHVRGSYARLGPVVARRLPRFFAGDAQPPIREGSGRRELARWVASEVEPAHRAGDRQPRLAVAFRRRAWCARRAISACSRSPPPTRDSSTGWRPGSSRTAGRSRSSTGASCSRPLTGGRASWPATSSPGTPRTAGSGGSRRGGWTPRRSATRCSA